MKKPLFTPLFAAWLAFIAFAMVPALRAQTETKPEEPVSPPPPAVVEPVVNPATPEIPEPAAIEAAAQSETEAAVSDEKSAELRELGVSEKDSTPETAPATPPKKKRSRSSRNDAPPFGNHHVAKDTRRGEAVSVFGNTTVDGEVSAAVSVMGSTTVNGAVTDEVVSVMGNSVINGRAHKIVTVMGDVILGPKAVVDGDIVVVMGKLEKAEGAQVLGEVQQVAPYSDFSAQAGFEGVHAWINKCLRWGRPLWIGEDLGWIWVIAGAFLAFYMILALIFPRGVVRSAEALELHPGATILAAFLTIIITPVAFVLLAITGIGAVLIPFLIIGLLLMSLFGMSAVLAWFGRRVLGPQAEGVMSQPFMAVLIGGVIVNLLYMVPFLGFVLWKLFGLLGVGMVVYALILSSKRDKPPVAPRPTAPVYPPTPAPVPTAMVAAAATAAATSGFATSAAPVIEPVTATPADAVPPLHSSFVPPPPLATQGLPVISAATLPRAGFWIRVGAALLDAVLIGIICGFISSFWHDFGSGFLAWFSIYCVAMWATKGTTIGGIICGLKVVRLDDRPVDWGVAVVRALGGFLSLCVAGLGFIWVAFDDDKQSWHDKIAGTTIVRVPKGTPLL